MSQRPTLDPSSFERLLAAAWVLQRQHEQKARNRRPATDETLAEPPETEVEPHCVSERDTTGACLMAALSKLREAAEPAVNQNTALGRAPTLNGIEQLILPAERQAGDQEPAPHGSSFRLPTRKRRAWSDPTSATVDTSPSRVLAGATEQTRSARQMIGTLTAAVGVEEAAALERKEISGIKIRESFRPARQSSVSWLVVREKWEPGTASVGHCAWRASQALRRANSCLSSTAISAARYRQNLWTEFVCRYLGEAQSFLLSALRIASQELRGATKYRPLSGLPKGALGQSLRHALPSLLNVAESAKNRLESFARYRVKVWVTFDSKPTLSPRRAVAAPGAPLLVLLIMVAFTLLQVWHGEHFHTVAAMSRMNHQSEENAVRKAEQFRPTPAVQVSHRQVTDSGVLSVVEALSRYEIRGLRRQADYGDDSAAFIMGMVYETGRYLPQSCTKAADWVTRSANAGSAAAQYNLGLRYRDGDGLPANEDEAEKWLGKAANQRYSNARLALETLTSRDARVRLVRRGEFEIRRRNTVGRRPSSSHVGGAL